MTSTPSKTPGLDTYLQTPLHLLHPLQSLLMTLSRRTDGSVPGGSPVCSNQGHRRLWWEANTELINSQEQPLYVKTLEEDHVTFVDPRTGVVAWRDPHPEVHAAPDVPA